MAEKVADIPLDGSTDGKPAAQRVQTAEEMGLRPALTDPASRAVDADEPLRVEVMDPHDLWDARDGMRPAIRRAAPAMVEAAAPAVARAVVQQAATRSDAASSSLRPAFAPEASAEMQPPAAHARTTIQLGAYSSEAAARSAWARVSAGAARSALSGLSPRFEAVEVNGRPLTRLKVSAPAETAAAVCRAAQVTDPWCARRT